MENIENNQEIGNVENVETVITKKATKQAIWFQDKELKLEFKRLRKENKMKPEAFLRELLISYKTKQEEKAQLFN